LNEKTFNLRAITTESGNVGIEQTTKNLIDILQLSTIKKFPEIGKGSPKPIKGKEREARLVHGTDGLGSSKLNLPHIDIKVQPGIDLIVREIISGNIDTIIATGPLTNIALALCKEPRIKSKLKNLYIMGGALRVPGNVTEHAEFNFFCDPEAVKLVLDSGIPITLVSLDVTEKAILTDKDLEGLKDIKTSLSQFIQHIADYSINYHKEFRKAQGAYIHDPLAVGIAIDESLGCFENLSIGIDVSGDRRGRIFIKEGSPNIRFCNNVDYKRFLNLFLERLEELSKEVIN